MITYDAQGCIPVPGVWSATPVFPGAAASELRRYCQLDYLGSGEPSESALKAIPTDSAAPDCLAVAPFSSFESALKQSFDVQVDTPELSGSSPAGTTWVGMVDASPAGPAPAAPYGTAQPGRIDHGYNMARLVEEVACPDGPGGARPCAVHVHHELALPRVKLNGTWVYEPSGGYYGYQTDLARAINATVDAYLAARTPATNLVVNLSLGWVPAPRFGGRYGDSAAAHAGARSVLAAVRRAVCAGAMVFAASGNESGGTANTKGPTYPAAWQDQPRPRHHECEALGVVAPHYQSKGVLLRAVGGVDGKDGEIGIARPESRPPLVAPAFMALADGPRGYTAPSTGTSVASAVASAATALAWAFAPRASANQMDDVLMSTAVSLNRVADAPFCTSVGCPQVRRVAACDMVQAACSGPSGAGTCPASTCLTRPAGADASPVVKSTMIPPSPVTGSGTVLTSHPAPPSVCASASLSRTAGQSAPGAYPCPFRQNSSRAMPAVAPHHGVVVCPTCIYVDPQGPFISAMIELEGDPSHPLMHPTLVVQDEFGGRHHYNLSDIGPAHLFPGTPYHYQHIEMPPVPIRHVFLTGIMPWGESVKFELLAVDP